MKEFLIIILFCFNCGFAYSQSDWFWQNPLPQGNSLYGLNVFDENNFLCISSNNILKTNNGGENWNLSYTVFPGVNTSITMFDQNTGILLIDSNVLLKTINGGNNWFYLSNVAGIGFPLYTYFISSGTGFLLSRSNQNQGAHILRTSNGGFDWNEVFTDVNFALYNIFFTDQLTGFAAGANSTYTGSNSKLRFFKTTDGGINWDSLTNPITLTPRSIYFIDTDTGFLGGNLGKMYKTTNGGINWNLLNTLSWNIAQIQFLNNDTGFALIQYGSVYRTFDGGITWNEINSQNDNVTQFYFLNNNFAMGVGYGGKIRKTINGAANWISQGSNAYNGNLWDVSFSDKNTGFITSDFEHTLLRTTNGGTNWDTINFDNNLHFLQIAKSDSYNWYFTTWIDGKILKTTNTGLSWDTLYTNLYGITRLEFINSNTGFGVCKYNVFFKTTNAGQSWIINSSLSPGQNHSMDFIDENTGFAGGDYTRMTTNGGDSWNLVNLGGIYFTADIQFVNHETGFIATQGMNGSVILKTTNTGATWQQKIVPGINYNISDIYFLNDRIGFALAAFDLFKTTNGGDNWYNVKVCTSNLLRTIYCADSLNIYCAGTSGTIIKTTNGGGGPVSIGPVMSEVPMNFNLFQNYPNPFNPVTKVKFDIPKQGQVTLRIYNVLGKEVMTLVNETKSRGNYEVDFDGSFLASGVYFYRLESGEFVEIKGMVLIK